MTFAFLPDARPGNATAPAQGNYNFADPRTATATGRRDRSPTPGRRPDIALRRALAHATTSGPKPTPMRPPTGSPACRPGIGPARALLVEPPHGPRHPFTAPTPAGGRRPNPRAAPASTPLAPREASTTQGCDRASPGTAPSHWRLSDVNGAERAEPALAFGAHCGRSHPCPANGGLRPYRTARGRRPTSPVRPRRCRERCPGPRRRRVRPTRR